MLILVKLEIIEMKTRHILSKHANFSVTLKSTYMQLTY